MQRVIEGPQPRSLRRPVTHRSFQLPILEVKQTERQPEILVCLIAVRDPGEKSLAAFEEVAHAQLAAYLLNVYGLALVSEARIGRDHKQPAEPRQSRNDVLDHPISKVLLLGIAAHVLKWQDSY